MVKKVFGAHPSCVQSRLIHNQLNLYNRFRYSSVEGFHGSQKSIKLRTLNLRRKRHMTQQELANRSQLSKTTISNLESGSQMKIELETIAKLCSALDCMPAELFELIEHKQNNLLQFQTAALAQFLASLDYDKSFEHEKLDSDLAETIKTIKREKKN